MFLAILTGWGAPHSLNWNFHNESFGRGAVRALEPFHPKRKPVEMPITDSVSPRPRIIELVGPPGSGKTTVARILQDDCRGIRVETFPYFRAPKHAAFFVLNFLKLAPDLIEIFFRSRGAHFVEKRDVAVMTILTGWGAVLKRICAARAETVVLEEGPICLLGKLLGFGSTTIHERAARQWWQKTYKKWAEDLDVVVVLQTPIPALLSRIRARDLQFEMRAMSDQEACDHLERIQAAQARALQELGAIPQSPVVFQIRTLNRPPEEIAAEISVLLGTKGALIGCSRRRRM